MTPFETRETFAINVLKAKGVDLDSETFLSRFPFILDEFLGEDESPSATVIGLRERLSSAAFADGFRSRTEEAIKLFCSDRGDDSLREHFLRMIDDFLNYAIPRQRRSD